MAYPVLASGAILNTNVNTSTFQVSVTAGNASDLLAASLAYFGTKLACTAIEISGAGHIDFVDPYGVARVLTYASGGFKPLSAISITATSNVDAICYW